MRLQTRRAFSLVEILVVVVIIAILFSVLGPVYLGGKKTPGGKEVPSPKQRARGVECTSYLQQLRQAYQMSTMNGDEEKPQSIQQLADTYRLPKEMMRCPVGKEPYTLDPNTGEIHCIHPGHEKL